jgi:hypothetical protein
LNGELRVRNLQSAICNLLRETLMGTYGLEEVTRRWQQGRLTTERAVGQILLLLRVFEERLREMERRLGPESGRGAP